MAMSVPEIQRLVEQLRHQARNPRLADPIHLLNLLSQYGEICEEVNVRLRTCGQLLNRGLRSEAIQLAEQVPSVLESVQLLECPEMPILEELMSNQGMVLPAGLLFDIASQLNAAYYEERQMSPLLREYRLLALSRAPLKMRLRLLRKIAKQDVTSMFWQDDQRVFEQERQMQLQREISDAGRAGNLAVLTELRAELASEDWVVKPPPELQHLAARNILRCEQANAQQQLQVLIEQLETAQQEQNFRMGESLIVTWQQVAQKAALKMDNPLHLRVGYVHAWLGEEQQRQADLVNQQQALYGLQQAIGSAETADELQEHYEHLWHGGLPIGDDLRERVEMRVAVLRTREKRRTLFRVAAVLLVALLLAGGAGWYWYYRTYQKNLAAAANALEKLLTDRNYDQAEKYLADLRTASPAMVKEQVIESLDQRLAKENSAERKRVADLQTQWEALEKGDRDNPDPFRLQQAEILVKTEEDKSKLKQWQQRAATAKEKKQIVSDSAFTNELEALRAEVTKFVQTPLSENFDKAEQDLNLLRAKIRNLQNTLGISTTLLNELPPLEQKLSTRWHAWDQQRRMDSELTTWLNVSNNADQYARALMEFSDRFPQADRGKDAAKAADELSLWKGSDTWLILLNHKDFYSSTLGSAGAKLFLELGQKANEEYPKHPFALEFAKHRPRLESIVARLKPDSDELISEDLRSLFRDQVFTQLQVLELKNGVRYYLTKDKAAKIRYDKWRSGTPEPIDCLTNFNGTTSNFRVEPSQVKFFGDASHCVLCSQLLELLGKTDHRNWDAQHLAMVRAIEERMNDTSSTIDPILNAIILKQVLRQGAAGSARFRTVYADKIKVLATEDLDLSVNWLKPDDEAVTKARVVTKAVLQDYLAAPLAEAPAILRKPELYERQGFVYRNVSGKWSWKVAQVPHCKAELAVLWQPDMKSAAKFVPVGDLDNGVVKFRDDSLGLLECRPLYLLRK